MGGSLFIAAGLQVGAVLIGYFWGVAVHYPGRPPSPYTFCTELAGLLMLGGIFASLVGYPVENAKHRASVCVTSLLYSVGIVLCEPFLHVHQFSEVVVAALLFRGALPSPPVDPATDQMAATAELFPEKGAAFNRTCESRVQEVPEF